MAERLGRAGGAERATGRSAVTVAAGASTGAPVAPPNATGRLLGARTRNNEFPLTRALSLCMDRRHHEQVFGDMVDTLRWHDCFPRGDRSCHGKRCRPC